MKNQADDEKIIMSISVDVATKKRLRKLAKAKHVTMESIIRMLGTMSASIVS